MGDASDLRKTVLKSLPSTVTLDGDAIEFTKVWGTNAPAPLPLPSWVVDFLVTADLTNVASAFDDRYEATATATPEVKEFDAADPFVDLDEKDAVATTLVTGTLVGVPHTFVQDTDFVLVDRDVDGGKDALEFGQGGDDPDDGTDVTVAYTHRVLERARTHLYRTTVQVQSVSSHLKSGERGATQRHEGVEVVNAAETALVKWFEKDLRPALEALDIGPSIKFQPSNVQNIKGSTAVFQRFTFQADFQVDVTLESVRSVRKASASAVVRAPGS